MILNDPIYIISQIKEAFSEVIDENNLNYGDDINNILKFYSMDFTRILNNYYPGGTIMMHKFYRNCALMIAGRVYNETGLDSRLDYHIALDEEINYINNTFPKIPENIFNKIIEKIESKNKGTSYVLKNNIDKK